MKNRLNKILLFCSGKMLKSKNSKYQFILALCLVGTVESIWEPYSISKIAELNKKAAHLSSSQIQNNAELSNEVIALRDDWNALIPLSGIFPEVYFRLGRSLLLSSLIEQPEDSKVRLLCESLKALQQAAQKSPHNPLFQIAWADLEGHLPMTEVTCEQHDVTLASSRPRLNPTQRLELAQQLAPFSVTDLYFAALAHLGLGEKQEALQLLRLNAEINPYFKDEQRGYVFQLIETQEDLESALPRRYPELIPWLDHFSTQRAEDLTAWHETFEAAVKDALKELATRLSSGELTRPQYATFLKVLANRPFNQHSEKLRKHFDRMLSGIYSDEGEARLANWLRKRQDLNRIDVLKSLISDDTAPQESMLYNWMSDANHRQASLDHLGRVLGLYLPADAHVKLIMLESASGGSKIRPDEIEVLLSPDNTRFFKDKQAKVEHLQRDGKDLLVIETEAQDARFVKIHYTGASQTALFGNELDQLIQVYGSETS